VSISKPNARTLMLLIAATCAACDEKGSDSSPVEDTSVAEAESGGSPDDRDLPNEVEPADACGAPMEKSRDLPTPVGACDTSAQFGFCIEYFDEGLLEDSALEAGCADAGGRFIRGGGCPVVGRLGACVDESLVSAVAHVYQTPGVTAQQVRTSCERDGDAVFCAP
jgi:hypothetical protein